MARNLDEEKRRKILDVSRIAFGTDGFDKTTIKTIASEAHIAQGTLYTYFANKEELFKAVVDDIWDVFIVGLAKISISGAAVYDKFHEFLNFGFELLREVHPLLRGMYSKANQREQLSDYIEAICSHMDDFFAASAPDMVFFGGVGRKARQFNLNLMVSGIMFRVSLTKPEDLDNEIATIKDEILEGLAERLGMESEE